MDIVLLALRVLLALLLYAFLGAILILIWRDLRQQPEEETVSRSRGKLVIVESADQRFDPATALPLQPITSIGRAADNTIQIADTYTSARHALLTWREGRWFVEDRESRNGTFVNDTRISEPTIVSSGDVIRIGRTEIRVEVKP